MKNIRVKQAAEYVGLSKSLLDKMRMGTEGPRFFKLGRAVVYSTGDLDAWLAARAKTTIRAANDNRPASAVAE